MARTKKQTESVNTGHMPRRGTCKKTPDGAHVPTVVSRGMEQIFGRMTWWPNLPEGLYVREQVECTKCGKRASSGRHKIDTLASHIAAGPTPMFRSPITPDEV